MCTKKNYYTCFMGQCCKIMFEHKSEKKNFFLHDFLQGKIYIILTENFFIWKFKHEKQSAFYSKKFNINNKEKSDHFK